MEFSEEMVGEIFKIFQVESEEIISRLNNNILDLENNPSNKDIILLLFRDAHSLKGASRMVGLNSVQTLAHKMEDVLGLAKDNKIHLNSKVLNVLYKTVDFLSELIQKAIKKGKDVYSEDVAKQISILENIYSFADEVQEDEAQEDFNSEFFFKNVEKINKLIPDCLVVLMQIEANQNEALIAKLLEVIRDLYDLFKNIRHYEIKNLFEDVKVKLEFIAKASNCLTVGETSQIQGVLNTVLERLTSLFELYNLPLVDYYSIAFEQMEHFQLENTVVKSESKVVNNSEDENSAKIIVEPKVSEKVENVSLEPVSEIIVPESSQAFEDFDFVKIKEMFSDLLNSKGSMSEIKDLLVEVESSCESPDLKNVLGKIVSILTFSLDNEIQINEEVVSVVHQSIDYCDNVLHNNAQADDKNLILQRLEITQQVLELSNFKPHTEAFVNPKEEKVKKINDFSEIFDTGAIKTLRVDSAKLDSLVNQVNELMISKIKTKKHLHELDKINKDVEEWQKNIAKSINHLMYYEKKYSHSSKTDSTFLSKQFLDVFSESNKAAQRISVNIKNLYRVIQEDDTKANLALDNLTNMVKNIRVLPLATVFHLFGRMVRDIAQEKNKKIDFEIMGSETSTDKKIIEEIKTPLIHIIRNAIDHGIESPDERLAMGKPPVGKILLKASQSNNKVIIEIIDDGRGINVSKLREKALQKGFLTEEELGSMSDEQVMNIIFAPGFSTGEEITNISGRGIGLDVVQSKIAQLNGKVSVISELNKGCCVQIELPTSMSLLNVFLVEVSGQTFAIPIESINTVLRKNEEDIIIGTNKKSIVFNNETVPLYELAEILNINKVDTYKEKRTIMIIESNNKIIAVSVDKLVGEQEILLKKLSAPLYKLKNIAGITTLVSGDVCLVLNISDIIKTTKSIKLPINYTPMKRIKNSNYKILLVDDSATTRTLEKNILSTIGYNVDTAENPIEAFDKLKQANYDLIITDVEMPYMSGFEFLKALKNNEMYSDIPVVMLSSLVEEENRTSAIKSGAVKYISKSEFNQEELQDLVSKILNK